MSVREIQEAMRLADSALRAIREAEKYAAALVGSDKTGYASHVYMKAKAAASDLERLKGQLRAVRLS